MAFSAFITDLANDPGRCFTGVPCLLQTSQSTVGAGGSLFGATNPIQWIRQILNAPGSVKDYNIEAIHRYDGISVTANAATNTFSTPKSVREHRRRAASARPGICLHRSRPAPTTSSSPRQRRPSRSRRTQNGNPIDLTNAGTGAITAERIRVIGDDP